MTRRTEWLARIVEQGCLTPRGLLRVPVLDIDTGQVYTPEQDRKAAQEGSGVLVRTPATGRCVTCDAELEAHRPAHTRYCDAVCRKRYLQGVGS